MKILTFPFHQPYQTLLFKTGHDFTIMDGYDNIWWNKRTGDIGSNERELPDNAKLLNWTDMYFDSISDYDVVILPTIEHIRLFHQLNDYNLVPTVNCHATCFSVPQDIPKIIGDRPLYYTTTSLSPLIWNGEFIKQGHDDSEYYISDGVRDEDRTDIIYPINRFRQIGNQVTGYDFRVVIKMLDAWLVGYNPDSEVTNKIQPNYEDYREILMKSDIGLQLSPLKARAFTTVEMMLAGTPVITRYEGNLFPHNSMRTFINHENNGFIAKNPFQYRNIYRKWRSMTEVERTRMRYRVRESARNEFPLHDFLDRWNEVLEEAKCVT